MDEKPKGSQTDPQRAAEQQTQRLQPGAKGARGSSASALDKEGHVKPEKLAENQRKLNVGADHRTPDMKKGHRGTFP